MGVSRLWSYLKANESSVLTEVDLVQVAKEYPGGMKLLVDFYCWEHFIARCLRESLIEVTGNPHLVFSGGEYKLMHEFLTNLIQEFRNVNIELVFYLDGAKGSAHFSTKHKLNTWKKRYFEEQRRLVRCFEYLRGQIPVSEIDRDHLTRPCLQEVQNVLTIQEAGCEIHLRVSGEADFALAKRMVEDDRVYAILSNDTDFCIFPNCVYLCLDYFDIHNDLGLRLNTLKPQRPEKLICGVIHTESIMRLLKLPNHQALVELAVIGGNDFTLPFLLSNPVFKSQYFGQFERLAYLINGYGCVERCEFFGTLMAQNQSFCDAVNHARQFYSLTLKDEEEEQTGYIFNLIADGIRSGKMPSTIVSMHQGTYWHRQVLEDPTPGRPVAEVALQTLRSYVYKMLLPRGKQSVLELGRTPHKLMLEMEVVKSDDGWVPSLAQVRKNGYHLNKQLFEMIIQHQEICALDQENSYFKVYGLRMGFLCFLLRYFLLLNWDRNLFLTPEEFYVVVAWVLGVHEDEHYLRMKIVPSPRCATVGSWMQVVYRNAYAFLANILGISRDFPAPKDLFSGAAWVVLYTACAVNDPDPTYREPMPLSVKVEHLKTARQIVLNIVKDNRHIVKNIVRGLFPLEI
ncbi:uncharacterized protein LOC131934962 [Physella acuta]|uniref:uncharacterized protein LOC131934962 n=1 Tax=Physella acuta TaxID=109671 RepID=UPI0027DBD752|nr:uncharacterized protein LOC131934962 [Physella acuta]